jgi:hypothetical protein
MDVFDALFFDPLEQVGEQRAVVNHRLPKVFGARLPFSVLQRNLPRGAIVHDDAGVIDGNVSDPLLKIADGIATGGHDFSNQPIGFRHGASRVIYETRLNSAPRGVEAIGIGWDERADVQLRHALRPRLERGFGLADVAFNADGSVVLRSESLSKSLTANAAERDQGNGTDQNDRDQRPHDC